ncbi:PREDICTED: uncharacterized protein LOC107332875 isoform X3 [Acropora digitifera]|uniref:uncharacterized protein LOC107332875 isoform X3 n=1 Tax=Acropora digitifera TaxID=70779 RepID=UPI00077A9617|nr:PREDICTED: uncharacterized protein LOC107332875 isoform X3 [Acropora digitifera]
MDNLNSEVLKFPVQESCGDEEEKDSRTRECKEKKRLQGNGSHSKELSLRSKLANPPFVPQSLEHDTDGIPYGIQCTEDVEKFEGVQSGSSLKNFKRVRKQILPRGCQRKFGEVKDHKSPSQPLKKKMIGNEGKRARKQILVRGCKRNFGEVKDLKSPSQPVKKKKIGNEGKRLVEKSEKRCRTHWGHENNPRCSKLFDPGGSHQTNFQVGEVGVIHLVFALQILRL